MLSVSGLSKSFPPGGSSGATVAVRELSLEVQAGQLFTLLGPSGCGKTTTLRCVAGLERPDSGEIELAGRLLHSSSRGVVVPANKRGLGMVHQSYGLWPHMNVLETVAFPLTVLPRRQRPAPRELRERVDRALAVVQLEGLEERSAVELSGGQQQRLALARALVTEPPLLLMDEPLSNLDALLRDDMRLELKRLQREIGVTVLYVTHDQAEALALSAVVAVMRDGRILQVGKPRAIYEGPTSRFVAHFLGSANLIDGTVREAAAGTYSVSTAQGTLHVRSPATFAAGDRVAVTIRSERVEVDASTPAADARPNRWRGVVSTRAFRGDSVEHVVRVGELEIRARCEPSTSIRPGTEVTVDLPEAACTLVPALD